jgi:hypothetical protein
MAIAWHGEAEISHAKNLPCKKPDGSRGESFGVWICGADHVAEKAIPDMMARVIECDVLVFGVLRSCDAGFARF